MGEPGAPIDACELETRLPRGWSVDDLGGAAIYGHAEDGADGVDSVGFLLRREGELCRAIWLDPSGELPPRADEVVGIPERCADWVVRRARDCPSPRRDDPNARGDEPSRDRVWRPGGRRRR